jgi:hypothetical protein
MPEVEVLKDADVKQLVGSQTMLIYQLQLRVAKLTRENQILKEQVMTPDPGEDNPELAGR